MEWIKCLQECVEKAASNERIAQMANLQEVIVECLRFTTVMRPNVTFPHCLQTRRTDKLLQQHLFRQDVFAERFQTKFDQERITSEVLNSRFCLAPH